VGKLAFRPLGVIAGLVAAALAQRLFVRVWALVDDSEPPKPDQRDADLRKLVPALLVQGAVFAVVRGLVDRGTRQAYRKATGAWPGEEGGAS
jgi:hypothetical protein